MSEIFNWNFLSSYEIWVQKDISVSGFQTLFPFNPYSSELIYLNFQTLEVVSRYRDPQLQVTENYSYLFNLSTNICKSSCLDTHSIPKNSDLVDS